ncbi:SDR family NAD(P)-dependent oxidoreductase [Pseudohaliea rubra]|uniref:Retinol dehydrogenase 13 n=1 Tax=Pseudohaliea rubra DSM 19751 TaxID=1265313 RepID=A0A095VS37_9GAMM|nr:SDR family NAD(P)-dependent oxidoreductase [Pseudohaliea rubra]KGE04272.1 Retinol dehydrogenase 13 [Pseudohaliea rubra DSM 19751]
MITLEESIDVTRPPAETFRYVSDFRTTAEWDATAFRARKDTPGPIREGTEYLVDCSLPVGSVRIRYRVTALRPGEFIELVGNSRLFTVTDRITFTPRDDGGTHIDYVADFAYKGPLASLEGALREGMERMGRKALEGMRHALEDRPPPPVISSCNERADRMVLPGLALFSRLGYRRGRKRWEPLSADLSGRHAVITGASSGIGRAAALRLAELGASLTLVMRDAGKAEATVAALRAESGNEAIRAELADLALMADVDALVTRLKTSGEPIDILVNNAGALFNPRQETAEGLEASFALLLLSPYRLTRALLPLLEAGGGARVINVVSGGMYSRPLEVRKLVAREENYSGSVAYARCKRALMVTTEQWADAWAERGIVVNAMHPGWADTPGVESSLPGFHRLTRRILRSPEEGADTVVWLAAAPEAGEVSGLLFLDREPRTTHLLARTAAQETAEEREALREFLAAQEAAFPADVAKSAAAR